MTRPFPPAAPVQEIRFHRSPLPADLRAQVASLELVALRDEATLWGADGLAETLAGYGTAIATLHTPDGLAAYCLFSCIGEHAEIFQIATAPQQRRQGLARQLLLSVLHAATEAGCERMFLDVRAGNVAACRLYQQIGFRTDRIRPNYYQGKPGARDALLMSCPLPAAFPTETEASLTP